MRTHDQLVAEREDGDRKGLDIAAAIKTRIGMMNEVKEAAVNGEPRASMLMELECTARSMGVDTINIEDTSDIEDRHWG